MGSGYFLQGLADGLKSGGLMDRGGRLAREKFEYQKRRDALMDERYRDQLLRAEAADELNRKKTALAIAGYEQENEDRQGKENFFRGLLAPAGSDSWLVKDVGEKSLGELGLMAGTLSANEQSKYLGGEAGFKMPVDPSILTTRARMDDSKANRALEREKLRLQGPDLSGDIKDFWNYTQAIEGKARLPRSYDEIRNMKEQTRPAPQKTMNERDMERRQAAVTGLSERAEQDPNELYENENFRMNDDGTLYIDPVSNAPIRLPSFYEATGKRGNIKAIKALGEQWDDAKELADLLALPEVQADLKAAQNASLWDRATGKWRNSISQWMQNNGIAENSNTATAIARIQRMASEERKLYMGTAVTDNEIKSALAWMPSAGDSFDTMVNKTQLMGKEAEQAFRRWIKIFEKDADMSPFYKAFGIKRFDKGVSQIGEEQPRKQKTEISERGVTFFKKEG